MVCVGGGRRISRGGSLFRIVFIIWIQCQHMAYLLSHFDKSPIHSLRVLLSPYLIYRDIIARVHGHLWAMQPGATVGCQGDFKIPHLGHKFHQFYLELG